MNWIKHTIERIRAEMAYRRKLRRKDPLSWIKNIIERVRLEIRYRKKLKELRKKDPFIYK